MKRICVILILSLLSFGANASLIDRGSGFIYDDVLDVTWLQDANINGLDTWGNQLAWADGLSVTHNGDIYDDWRLPSALNGDGSGPCTGYSCTSSEMGSLFYDTLGNTAGTFTNAGPFINLESYVYWLGTEGSSDPVNTAWNFSFDDGYQSLFNKSSSYYAIAVRDGDVATIVPIPATVWLFGSALGLLGWMFKKAYK